MAKDIVFKLVLDGSQVAVNNLTDVKLAITEINKKLKETTDETAYEELSKDLVQLKAIQQQFNEEQRKAVASVRALSTGDGSYRQLSNELANLRASYKELSQAEREGAIGQETQKNIQILDTKLKDIDAGIGQFQRNVGDYQNAINRALAEYGQADNVIASLKQIETQTDELINQNKQLAQSYTTLTTEANAKLDSLNQELKNLEASAQRDEVAIENLKQEIIQFSNVSEQQIQGVADEMLQLKQRIDANNKTLEEFKDIASGGFDNILTSLSQFAPIFGTIQNSILGVQQGVNGIGQAATTAGKTMARAFIILGVVTAVVEAISYLKELTDESKKAQNDIQVLTNLQGEALNEATAGVLALSKVYNQEANEITRSTNALAKSFGISFNDALGLVEKGFNKGLNVSGEFLDNLKEYSVQFKASGLSAGEFFDVIQKSNEQGIFSDKAVDTVKEFGLRIREQATSTKDALTGAFGEKFTKDLFKGLNDGSISSGEALKTVSKELNNTKLTAQQTQTVIADVFGGAGEDAGLEFIKSLQDINTELESNQDNLTDFQKYQQDLTEATKQTQLEITELADSVGASTGQLEIFGERAKGFLLGFVNDTINFAKGIFEVSKQITTDFIDGWKTVINFFSGEGSSDEVGSYFTNLGTTLLVTFNIIKEGFLNLPSVYAGVKESLKQATDSTLDNLRKFTLNAEILFLKAKKFTVGLFSDAEKKDAEDRIKNNEAELKTIEKNIQANRTLTQAFLDGYNQSKKVLDAQKEQDRIKAEQFKSEQDRLKKSDALTEEQKKKADERAKKQKEVEKRKQDEAQKLTDEELKRRADLNKKIEDLIKKEDETEQKLNEQFKQAQNKQKSDDLKERLVQLRAESLANIDQINKDYEAEKQARDELRLELLNEYENEFKQRKKTREDLIKKYGIASDEVKKYDDATKELSKSYQSRNTVITAFDERTGKELLDIQQNTNNLIAQENEQFRQKSLDERIKFEKDRIKTVIDGALEENKLAKVIRENQIKEVESQIAKGVKGLEKTKIKLEIELAQDELSKVDKAIETIKSEIQKIENSKLTASTDSILILSDEELKAQEDNLQSLNDKLADLLSKQADLNNQIRTNTKTGLEQFSSDAKLFFDTYVNDSANSLLQVADLFLQLEDQKQQKVLETLNAEQEASNQRLELLKASQEKAFGLEKLILKQKIDNELKEQKRIEDEKLKIEKEQARKRKAIALAEATINLAGAIIKVIDKPFLIPFVATAGALQIANIVAQEFADGGKIADLTNSNGVITAQPNIKPTSKGDNILAYVKKGEAILNEKQQRLIGYETLKNIGVPGFANGGIIGTLKSIPNLPPQVYSSVSTNNSDLLLNLTAKLSENILSLQDRVDNINVVLNVNELNDAQTNINELKTNFEL